MYVFCIAGSFPREPAGTLKLKERCHAEALEACGEAFTLTLRVPQGDSPFSVLNSPGLSFARPVLSAVNGKEGFFLFTLFPRSEERVDKRSDVGVSRQPTLLLSQFSQHNRRTATFSQIKIHFSFIGYGDSFISITGGYLISVHSIGINFCLVANSG